MDLNMSRRTLLRGLVVVSGVAAAPAVLGPSAAASGVAAGPVAAVRQYPVEGLGVSLGLPDAVESQRLVWALADFLRLSSLDIADVTPVSYARRDQPFAAEHSHFSGAVCVSQGAFDRGRCEALPVADQRVAKAVAAHHGVTWGGDLASDATGLFLAEPMQGAFAVAPSVEGLAAIGPDLD